MPAREFPEDFSSLIPALELLVRMGYTYLPPSRALALRGGKTRRLVLGSVLAEQLRKLNSITFKGKIYPFSDNNIQKAVDALEDFPFDSLLHVSAEIYDLITLGKSLEQTIDGYSKSYSLHYVDWKNPANNVFHVSDEFEVEKRHSRSTRRPDLVLFVNGIPFAAIECKRPDIKNPIAEAISQHLRNQRVDEIPGLFAFTQILLAVSQNQAQYGTTDTKRDFWAVWKEEGGAAQEKDLRALLARPLPQETQGLLLSERPDWQQRQMISAWSGPARLPSPQDAALHSLLRPERLLELSYRYIIYDNTVKKITRYQQYFAVQATLRRICAESEGSRPGGVIWHTTGSGKSLTMVMLAKAIALEPSIPNVRVVLVTDRVDLDDQIYKTFLACGKAPVQAKTGEHLLDLLESGQAGIIATIIDKFETASRKKKVEIRDRNIFVLVDESHRSQYGITHAKMRGIFPNACYIGFTGTPLLKSEKSTAAKFGGLIHSYSMRKAIEDGAVRPLLYEGRMAELRGTGEQLDRWFDRITDGLTPQQKADLKRRFRREEELTKSGERLAEIAYDVGRHFRENFKGTGKKGQFAVSGIEDAILYKQKFDEFKEVSTEVVISHPDTRNGNVDTNASTVPIVQAFWKDMMDRYGSEQKYQESIIRAFKDSDDPELLIVVDKLLTGFDVPRNTVLYLDKRLREHNILQAIARVNRVFEGKEFGLVIDYRGIFGEIHEALDTYAAFEKEGFDLEDVENTLVDIRTEIASLAQRHSNVWEVFKEVRNKKDLEAMQRHLEPQDSRDRFYETLKLFARTLQLALGNADFLNKTPESKLRRYKDDLAYFLNLRRAVKQRFGEAVDYSSYEKQIRNLVTHHIGAEAVRQLVPPTDLFAADSFEKELDEVKGDAAKADVIASRMKKTITEKMEEDPVLYKRLSQVIEEAIIEHRAQRISDAEYLRRIRQRLDELRGGHAFVYPSELEGHEDAKAYFGLVRESPVAYSAQGSSTDGNAGAGQAGAPDLAEVALKIEAILESHKIRDWSRNPDVQKAIYNDIEDYLLELRETFALEIGFKDIDALIEQILSVAKRRETR